MNPRIVIAAALVCLISVLAGDINGAGRISAAIAPPEATRGSRAAAQEIARDSLRAMVRFLSVNPTADSTRFALRENAMAVISDSLAQRLERYTGSAVLRQPFPVPGGILAPDSTYTAQNLIARSPGNGSIPGVVLLTAHYDCTSQRTQGWGDYWTTWPSPGADDNATGVAAVMEAARVLSQDDLPFSVLFVLFSAEEFDRLGSKYFVEHYDSLIGDRIIAVVNADMLGYSLNGTPGGSVVANYDSGWLAEVIADSAAVIDPSLPLAVVKPGPRNSDHASFWDDSTAAVMLIEPLGEAGTIANPHYHSLSDTLGTLDFEQAERLTRLMVGFVAGLGGGAPEISLLQSDLLLAQYAKGRKMITSRRAFRIGDTIEVDVRVRNMGARDAPPASNLLLRVSVENGNGTREIFSHATSPPRALEMDPVRIPLVLDEPYSGENVIRASIVVSGMEDDPGNNAALDRFAVETDRTVVLMHSFQPNPVTGAFPSASFCANLTREVELTVELYNIEGQLLAKAGPGTRWGGRLRAGLNRISCAQLFPGLTRLASGVYAYRLVVREQGGRQENLVGHFAVQH